MNLGVPKTLIFAERGTFEICLYKLGTFFDNLSFPFCMSARSPVSSLLILGMICSSTCMNFNIVPIMINSIVLNSDLFRGSFLNKNLFSFSGFVASRGKGIQ